MDDARQHPTTYALSALWILVYIGMTLAQGEFLTGDGLLGWGGIKIDVAHAFGALTARDVASGQLWRTVTATFVHFSLLHMVMNMTCLISFGRVLESWYGSPQFLAIYVAIAGVGNSLAVAARYAVGTYASTGPLGLHSYIDVVCAGGSSVMFGFIAMIAVVGWRSKTRFGDYVRRQMTGKLIFYGLIVGIAARGILDNYGHGGGAIAGAALGFGHRYLLRWEERPSIARALGTVAAVVLVACAIAQARAERRPIATQAMEDPRLVAYLCVGTASEAYETIVRSYRTEPVRTKPARSLALLIGKALVTLDQAFPTGIPGVERGLYQRWRTLVEIAAKRFPTPDEVREFERITPPLIEKVKPESLRKTGVATKSP